MKVFISYSQKDRKFVSVFVRALQQYSIEVWLDKDRLEIGDSLPHRLTSAIGDVDFVIVVISPNSMASEWVSYEMKLAIRREEKDKKNHLLPLLLHGAQLPDLIKHRVFADFRSVNVMAESFPLLLQTIGVTQEQYPKVEIIEVTSPMVGYFLANRATKMGFMNYYPAADPFVEPDSDQTAHVTAGQVVTSTTLLGRIGNPLGGDETQLFAECEGVVDKILVENMQLLEYGQVLMVIRKDNADARRKTHETPTNTNR